MSRHFAITVAYDGTEYGGWQIQPNAITVQQLLIEAIEKATSERTHVQGSGRTDSGVHATGQIAAFVLQGWSHTADRLIPAINRFLPVGIVVRRCREVVMAFDPIRDAKSKRYRYSIRNARVPDPMHHRLHWWIPKELDVESMKQAAMYLHGMHDFTAFETLGSPRKTSMRTVYELCVLSTPSDDGMNIEVEIEADGFLYNMVRNIVGALREVGTGRFSPRWIQTVLESKERTSASITAPARGLCLIHVQYPESVFLETADGLSHFQK